VAEVEQKSFENVKQIRGVETALDAGEVEDTGTLTVLGGDLEFRGAKGTVSMPRVRRLSTTVLGRLAVEFGDPPEERHFIAGRGLRVRAETKRLLADLERVMNLAPVSVSESEARDLQGSGRRQIRLAPLAILGVPVLLFAIAFGFRFLWRGIFASDWDADNAWDFAFPMGVTGIGIGLMATFFLVMEGRAKIRRSRGR
jgi:pilus assembly protein TadC